MPEALSQRDPRWANVKLGTSNTTLHDYGCTLTALTMLLNHYGGNYTPDQVNEKMKSVNGFSNGNLIIWSAIPKAFPQVKSAQRIWSYDNELVKSNIPVMVEVDGSRIGASKHWVLYVGNQRLNDPWYGNEKSTSYYAPTGCAVLKVEHVNNYVDNSMMEIEKSTFERLITEANQKDEKIKKLEIELQTEKDNIGSYKRSVGEFLREMVMILDPNTLIEIADESLVKNLAKKLVSDFSDIQSELAKKQKEWALAERQLEEENQQLETQVKTLKEEIERLLKRVERVESDLQTYKEKKQENKSFGDWIINLIRLFERK